MQRNTGRAEPVQNRFWNRIQVRAGEAEVRHLQLLHACVPPVEHLYIILYRKDNLLQRCPEYQR